MDFLQLADLLPRFLTSLHQSKWLSYLLPKGKTKETTKFQTLAANLRSADISPRTAPISHPIKRIRRRKTNKTRTTNLAPPTPREDLDLSMLLPLSADTLQA